MIMNSKYDFNRRAFLAETAKGLGLVTASSLFNLNAFAQTPKKNIVFVYFNYSALIPRKNNLTGEFHLNGGSKTMASLDKHKSDALFIREASVKFSGTSHAGHFPNHVATLTGFAGEGQSSKLVGPSGGKYDGTSVDLVAGEHLQNTYNTTVKHVNLAYSSQHADNASVVKGGFLWRTVSFQKNGNTANPVKPNLSPTQVYNSLKGSVQQACANTTPTANNNVDNSAQIAQLQKNINHSRLILDNLGEFKSNYLIPKTEFDKLEVQVANKVKGFERQLAALNSENDNNNPPPPVVECSNLTAPNNVDESPRRDYNYFHRKSNAFFNLIAASFKSNYCRSFTYYTSAFAGPPHGNAHNNALNGAGLSESGQVIAAFNREIFKSVDSLVNILKRAGVYSDTMVVLVGEFPHQNDGGDKPDHRIDNMPWLVLNSGKNGEYTRREHGRILHPSDIHVSLLNKLGMPITSFGSANHESKSCLLYTSPSPRDRQKSRMPSSA